MEIPRGPRGGWVGWPADPKSLGKAAWNVWEFVLVCTASVASPPNFSGGTHSSRVEAIAPVVIDKAQRERVSVCIVLRSRFLIFIAINLFDDVASPTHPVPARPRQMALEQS